MNSYDKIQASWQTFRDRKVRSASSADVYRYQNLFAKGYFIAGPSFEDIPPGNWLRIVLPTGAVARLAPDLTYTHLEADDCSLLLLGNAFHSTLATTTTDATAKHLFDDLKMRGFDSFEERVVNASGRFVAFAHRGRETRVYGDPMASLSCLWGKDPSGNVVLASHSALVAAAVNDSGSAKQKWVMTHPDYVNPGGKTLPALVTPFDCARELFANCYLSIVRSNVTHRRFYPRKPLESMSLKTATSIFIDEVRFNVSAWLDICNHSYLALTAGRDSRAILTSALDMFQDSSRDVTLMTYHFFKRASPSTATDLLKANELALEAALPFKVVNVVELEGKSPMADLYRRTFPTWARFPSLAASFYTQLMHDSSLFLGIGGGIGTAFFAKREDPTISAEVLARKYAYSGISKDPQLVRMFNEYIEYTQFHHDRIFNYDFYDLFHWEHRLSKWAATGYAEYDLSSTVALPMNSRKMIEAMLALDFEDRANKLIYDEIGRISSIA